MKLSRDWISDYVDLSGISELRGIMMEDNKISIGAATTLSELATNPIIQSRRPKPYRKLIRL